MRKDDVMPAPLSEDEKITRRLRQKMLQREMLEHEIDALRELLALYERTDDLCEYYDSRDARRADAG